MANVVRHFACKFPRISTSFTRIVVGNSREPYLRLQACSQYNVNSTYCTDTSKPSPWQLMSAVCVERYPVISQELDETQRRYQNLVDQEEFEESYVSDHEIKVAHELELLAKKKKGISTEEDDEEETERADTSALEREDRAKAELSAFVPANKITEADEKNDLHSLERNLSDRLILLVKCKLGDDSLWMMPQGNWQEEESLKQTAERVLISHSRSDDLRVQFTSGVPCGFYKFKYPKAVRNQGDKIGAKVFFFKARYLGGGFQLNAKLAEDYMWVTLDELDKYLNQSYTHKVKKFVLPMTIQHPTEQYEEETPSLAAAS